MVVLPTFGEDIELQCGCNTPDIIRAIVPSANLCAL